jgi:alpha-amylase
VESLRLQIYSGTAHAMQEECIIPEIVIGFELHQPLRLRREFSHTTTSEGGADRYFDPINRDILEKVAQRCYNPATALVLEGLDAGHQYSYSFSGTLIEQLDHWSPDTLELLNQVARHRNSEVLAQTYYHSIASLFKDKTEFARQIYQHMDTLWDLFHVRPVTIENTEFIYSNEIAAAVHELGFLAAFTEGAPQALGGRSPNNLYLCMGMPTLMRNTQLSDDIAYRYGGALPERHFPQTTLSIRAYADAVAAIDDPIVSVFLDYETFGEHYGEETGIFDFLQELPDALQERGVNTTLPRRVIEEHQPVDVLTIREPISWADREKDLSAWAGTEEQRVAISAVEKAEAYAQDLELWRNLQISDHFYYMARKKGDCGEVHQLFNHQSPDEAFRTYMEAIASFMEESITVMQDKEAARVLRVLPPDLAFHFKTPSGDNGHTAFDLDQFAALVPVVPAESIRYHQSRGDIGRWLREVIGAPEIADLLEGEKDPAAIVERLTEAREKLWSRLN